MKVADKVRDAVEEGRTIFSFEYHPPRPTKNQSVDTFLELVRRMSAHGPEFCDLTWGAGGSTAGLTLELSGRMQNEVGVETMMHLTVLNMPVAEVDEALDASRAAGLQNILALRGDPPIGQEDSFEKKQSDGGLDCALDLVEHIKRKHGDYFGIVVAGYPEGHPCKIPKGEEVATEKGYQEDLVYLKRKVDAGADMIITQLFYDVDLFLKFLDDCRAIGITCPILPGILPITTYAGFKRMTQVCRTRVPPEVRNTLDSIKDDRVAVRKYGVDLATEMCRKMLGSGVKTLHFYTMNNETAVLAILRNVGLVPPEEPRVVDRPLSAVEEEDKDKKAAAAMAAAPQAVCA